MDLNTISPLDNRYYPEVKEIGEYFSLKSWIYYRLKIEILYFIYLIKLLNHPDIGVKTFLLNDQDREFITTYFKTLDVKDEKYINFVLELEKDTKHDIKAIEYLIVEIIKNLEPKYHKLSSLVHFGLTSQDINSPAFSLQFKTCIENIIEPNIILLYVNIQNMSTRWEDITMLAHTHGQPAIPTKLGKELRVFAEKINFWLDKLSKAEHKTKFSGAVGTLSAHKFALPEAEWEKILHGTNGFLENLGLGTWKTTTQISNYDDIIYILGILVGINNIFIDLCQDMWLYISKGYFNLKVATRQVGSSAMPQKVNPINFENAEGNLKMANAGLEFMINKLPISRLQRDLTDSTVLRNTGTYLANSLLAYKNIVKGLSKLEVNEINIRNDLERHPQCLAEAVQTLLRLEGIQEGYEIMRILTQNKTFTNLVEFKKRVFEVIREKEIDVSDRFRKKMKYLNYDNY